MVSANATPNPKNQPRDVGRVSTMELILSVTVAKVCPGSMTGALLPNASSRSAMNNCSPTTLLLQDSGCESRPGTLFVAGYSAHPATNNCGLTISVSKLCCSDR